MAITALLIIPLWWVAIHNHSLKHILHRFLLLLGLVQWFLGLQNYRWLSLKTIIRTHLLDALTFIHRFWLFIRAFQITIQIILFRTLIPPAINYLTPFKYGLIRILILGDIIFTLHLCLCRYITITIQNHTQCGSIPPSTCHRLVRITSSLFSGAGWCHWLNLLLGAEAWAYSLFWLNWSLRYRYLWFCDPLFW